MFKDFGDWFLLGFGIACACIFGFIIWLFCTYMQYRNELAATRPAWIAQCRKDGYKQTDCDVMWRKHAYGED